jgi:hypothetical protein
MKNVTITMDEEVARWARIAAAERNVSVSRMVGEILREKMVAEGRYALARAQFDAIASRRLRKQGERLPSRDDLHERAGFSLTPTSSSTGSTGPRRRSSVEPRTGSIGCGAHKPVA